MEEEEKGAITTHLPLHMKTQGGGTAHDMGPRIWRQRWRGFQWLGSNGGVGGAGPR